MTTTLTCSICRKPVPADSPALPFCSSRCRTIDLGNWLSGRYAIAGEEHLDEVSTTGAKSEPNQKMDRETDTES